MGAASWSVSLSRDDQIVREWTWCAGAPWGVQPWRHAGSEFAFPLFSRDGNAVLAASVAGDELPPPAWPSGEYLASLKWAPRSDRLIRLGSTRLVLLDVDFCEVASHGSPRGDYHRSFAAWLGHDDVFFLLSPDSRLRFFAGVDGRVVGEDVVDPRAVLPLQQALTEEQRGTYSLALGPGLTAAGDLVDTWVRAHYDAEANELLLMTYRPIPHAPMRERAEIPVTEAWVAVEFE